MFVDRGRQAQRQRRRFGRLQHLDTPERVADAADPHEAGVAREIVAARQRGVRDGGISRALSEICAPASKSGARFVVSRTRKGMAEELSDIPPRSAAA
ncbi:MAG: hypothetical protein U1E30_05015 [Rhodoblastus sp.]